MSRTNDAAVIEILAGNYTSGASLVGVIAAASSLVDQVVACALRKGKTLTTEQLELIERFIAAHLYGHGDQFLTTKSTMSASGSFQGKTSELGLGGSQYGQTAMLLDPYGCLKAINSGARASVVWLGKPKTSQLTAEDRGDT